MKSKMLFMLRVGPDGSLRFKNRSKSIKKFQGFSLIEVLVTLVILSLGLLGVAGLLVSGISNAASSESLTKANQLAAEMADRIRANPAIAASASSEYITTWSESVSTIGTGTLSIAKKDKSDWLGSLASQLPLGDGRITSSVVGSVRKLDIEIRWNNCIGTLSDADKTSCASGNELNAYKTVLYELHL